ncbi:MAG TPA: cyclic nucleotide-binding domain-containing protein [Acidimicrobiales bacterium]|nr:cyclic nucleotide-binding domain-containing protein [Acidimicrobiales bacterium]
MSSIWQWDEPDSPPDYGFIGGSDEPEQGDPEFGRPVDMSDDRPLKRQPAPFRVPGNTSVSRVRQNLHVRRKVALLRGVHLFSRCTEAQLAQVAALTIEGAVPAGTVLAKRGEPGLELFVVVEGHAIVARKGRRLAVAGPGSFFGELALLDGGKRAVTVVAETDMHLLVLQRREFNRLYQSSPAIIRKVLVEVGSQLRGLDDLLDPSPALGPTIGPWSL